MRNSRLAWDAARLLRVILSQSFLGPGLLAVLTSVPAWAQADLPIYTDRLVNGFQDWSWASSRNLANASAPIHSGSRSISVSANAWEAISLHQDDFDVSVYSNFVFWVNGGSTGGQLLQVNAEYGTNTGPSYPLPSALAANTWQQYTIPLTSLGVAAATNVNRFTIQLTSSGASGTFYLDDIQLTARPAPALVNIAVNTSNSLRVAETRWFGLNTAIWDSEFSSNISLTIGLLQELGVTTLRFPGGSLSDEYHWYSNKTGNNTWEWWLSFAEFTQAATNIGAQVFITANYGTGTPQEAAAWVRHANVTNHLAFKYWEIGNECYGDWEADTNINPHDPYTYAVRATNYIRQMKAADPSIKVGIVVAAGENSSTNAYTHLHPVINPRTGETNRGWTPILLATLKLLGVTPDFAIYHYYPEYTFQESDPLLLQRSVNWARDAAGLRQQITDYFGAAGTNIELVVTENNSNAGQQGRQSTSLVNGLYYADSLAQLAKTEFNAFVWWDLRNSTDTAGLFDPTLYGWRDYGDLGMVNGLTNRSPVFYAAKLMRHFIEPGDKILNATSDYLWLSSYAARKQNGSVNLLVLNKDTVTNLNAQISLNDFSPSAVALLTSYGIPQDEAARMNGNQQARDVSTNSFGSAASNFSYDFPPLSMTLFTLTPAAPGIAALPPTPDGRFVCQLQGQPDVPYVLQSSSNLTDWTPVSTNSLAGNTLNVTNSTTAAAQQFWRAAWMP